MCVLIIRFNFVPAFAIWASPETLIRLRNDASVSRVDIDAPNTAGGAAAPDESGYNVSPLQGLGLDGTGMIVVVIDSGANANHVDLQSQLVGQQCIYSNSKGCCSRWTGHTIGYTCCPRWARSW